MATIAPISPMRTHRDGSMVPGVIRLRFASAPNRERPSTSIRARPAVSASALGTWTATTTWTSSLPARSAGCEWVSGSTTATASSPKERPKVIRPRSGRSRIVFGKLPNGRNPRPWQLPFLPATPVSSLPVSKFLRSPEPISHSAPPAGPTVTKLSIRAAPSGLRLFPSCFSKAPRPNPNQNGCRSVRPPIPVVFSEGEEMCYAVSPV
jgi:hypothetical protein